MAIHKVMLAVSIVLLLVTPFVAESQLHLSLVADQLVVDKVTAGGTVVVTGVVHSFPGLTIEATSPYYLGTDSNGDERISLPVGGLDSSCAVLAAVDLMTGLSGFVIPNVHTSPDCGGHRNVGLTSITGFPSSKIELEGHLMSIVIVRPRVGVWRTQVGDGGPFDDDGAPNGKILLEAQTLARNDDLTSAMSVFRPGDVVVTAEIPTREMLIMVLGRDSGSEPLGTE